MPNDILKQAEEKLGIPKWLIVGIVAFTVYYFYRMRKR